jgi:hypothetical protein
MNVEACLLDFLGIVFLDMPEHLGIFLLKVLSKSERL